MLVAMAMTVAGGAGAETDLVVVQQEVKAGHEFIEVKANTLKNLRQGVALLSRHGADARLSKGERLLIYTDIARAQLRIGDLIDDSDAKIVEYDKGRKASQQAQALDPKNADAVFWEAATAGCIGREKGPFKAASQIPELRAKFEQALKLDPNHHYARDSLAQMYHLVPGILGGSDDKAEELFREVIRRDPHFTPVKVHFASFLIDEGREDEAKVFLQQVRDAKRTSVPHDFRKFNRPNAIRMLQKLDE